MEETKKREITIGAVYSGISYQHGVLFRDEYRISQYYEYIAYL
jgi:hypothetical protein